MRSIIITVLMLMLPSLAMAQGQVTRPGKTTPRKPRKTTTVSKPKPTKTTTASKPNRNSGTRNNSSSGRTNNSGMTAEQKQRIIDNLVNNMVYVSGGTFTMGATSEQGSGAWDNEKPAHRVTLSSYYIGRYEVTQAEWKAVMGSNPSNFKGDNLPVECVSWNDCQEFIRKLNTLTGKNFRLPTEAEWEFAARGGNNSSGYKYSGSGNIGSVAWYTENSNGKTHPVGQKSPNELGLYDMSGNVYEWCQDWYGSYPSYAQTNPTGPNSGSYRVCRGGSWDFNAGCCRVSLRIHSTPGDSNFNLGLRLVL